MSTSPIFAYLVLGTWYYCCGSSKIALSTIVKSQRSLYYTSDNTLCVCVLSGVGVPTFVSGVLLQLQIADDRPGVGGVESATWDNILGLSLA